MRLAIKLTKNSFILSVLLPIFAFGLFPHNLHGQTSNNKVIKQYNNPDKQVSVRQKFVYEPSLASGQHVYIVELNEMAVAQAPDAIAELKDRKRKANNKLHNTKASGFTPNSAIARQLARVKQQQSNFIRKASAVTNNTKSVADYQFAINGLALRLSQKQAQTLALLPEVKRIQRSKIRRLDTDRGPTLIGAPRVWNGSAFATIDQTQGEGVVVGIIDSGINTDHPSFAEIAGDGYIHTNPLGTGIYLGDCASGFPGLCNNKLIGVYSYSVITNAYSDTSVFPPNVPANGEDYDGHGSHVASTAAGNILFDVEERSPEVGENRGSGIPTGFIFSQISGVAPRANIISYQVCYPGSADNNDTYADCVDSAILLAIDDAIKDNVDVINYSISGGGDPWSDITELAFLQARNAGIFVATSAGNSGPEAETTEKHAPWYSSVAASEHGRENIFAKQLQNFTGGTSTLGAISGQSNSGSVTAPIVFAGDFSNPNDPVGNSRDCLEPFPSNTFDGQIVVCDRGDIPRVDKARNVAAGGAGGFVLANIEGGQTFLANDQYVVPGIHINAEDGDRLKSWLATGSNHRATITVGESRQFIDPDRVDVLSSFSSRGPNTSISTLAPTMTAPGQNIYAAFANEQLGRDGDVQPAPSDFDFLSGTSMSSPHVAGAAALLKSAHPSWDPDEIRSALSLTATPMVKKEDANTDATYIDMGAGRIQVDRAIASGLVMTETANNYTLADPDIGGDPRSLNLPSLTDNACAGACTWQRVVKATTDATWQVTTSQISPGINITVSPEVFTLEAGQSQTLTISIDSTAAVKNEYTFGSITLSSVGLPDANIPVSVVSTIGDIPLEVDIEARRDVDTLLLNELEGVEINDLEVVSYAPVKATVVAFSIAQDPTNEDYLDSSTGTNTTIVDVPQDSKRFVAYIKSTSSQDTDLFVLRDSDEDGLVDITEEVARSNSSSSFETIMINDPDAGRYFIVVQNYLASSNNADTVEMRYAVVNNETTGTFLDIDAPSQLQVNTPFDLRFNYDLNGSEEGDDYFAAAVINSANSNDIALMNIDIRRVADDVIVDGPNLRAEPNDIVPFNVTIAANPTNEARDYLVTLPLPVGTDFESFSTANNGQEINNQLQWRVTKNAGDVFNTILNFQLRILDGAQAGPIVVAATSELSNISLNSVQQTEPYTDVQIEGAPIIDLNGSNILTLSVVETQTISIPLSIQEPNGDNVSVVWTQTEGPSAIVLEEGAAFNLTAPTVTQDSVLRFDVTVTDINNQIASASLIVNVINNGEPVINSITAPTNASNGSNITLSISASDPENDTLHISVNGSRIAGTSTTVRTPTTGTSVSYRIDVSDGISITSEVVRVSLTANSSGGGGGGSLPLLFLLVAPLALYRRFV